MSHTENNHKSITIHIDGACIGNPGPGGYAAILRRLDDDGNELKSRRISGGESNTTNNRMEMMAAIHGLRQVKTDEKARIKIVSDSQTLVKGMNEWLPGWLANNWRASKGTEVANKDLWLNLVDLCDGKDIHWCWVRGHNGNRMNEEADRLARAAAQKYAKQQSHAA